jgi:hypothetical protein
VRAAVTAWPPAPRGPPGQRLPAIGRTAALRQGIAALREGIAALREGIAALREGIAALRQQAAAPG